MVARERAEADRRVNELQAQLDRLKPPATPAAPPKPDDPAYVESIRAPLLAELSTYKEREQTRETAAKRTEVKSIAKEFAVDGAEEDVANALSASLKLNAAGKYEVVDASGNVRYGVNGPMTPKELVVEHFKAKPYLAKPTVRSGLGIGNTPANADTLASSTDALKAQIADAETKKDFALAGRLKSQLLEAQRPVPRR